LDNFNSTGNNTEKPVKISPDQLKNG